MKNTIKQIIKAIPGSKYIYIPLARIVYPLIFLIKLILGKEQVIIYTMGKVGTVSLGRSIKTNKIQKHYFVNKRPFFEWNRKDYVPSKQSIGSKIYLAILMRSKVKIITAFRDPYARNVSLLFQTIHHYLYYLNPGNIEDDNFSSSGELLDHYFFDFVRQEAPFIWFKEELEKTTNVDIFQYPFDKEKGYAIINKNKISILVLTLEKMNQNEEVIADFIGDSTFKLEHKNDGTKKWYADLYESFKARNKLSNEQLVFYYDNDIVRHFYDDAMIESFKKKWAKNYE
jgi:hypothetical protein